MPSKLPPKVKEIPKVFCLWSYDPCKEWGALDWYKALIIRASIMNLLEKSSGDIEEHKSYQIDAMALLKNPLQIKNPWLTYPLMESKFRFVKLTYPLVKSTGQMMKSIYQNIKSMYPLVKTKYLHHPSSFLINDQTVEEFFEGISLIDANPRYHFWYERARVADEEHYDLDEDFNLETDEPLYLRLLGHRFKPAWQMHRDITPNPLTSSKRFFISVDLGASDKFLEETFKEWVKKTRDKTNIHSKGRHFNKKDFEEWHNERYLPLLDLSIWAAANQGRVTGRLFKENLYANISVYTENNIYKRLVPNARSIISDENISALKSQAYHYGND
jgi:hypothetical protein